MKKPIFDYVDRYLMKSPTWIGRSLRRELKFMRIKRKLFKL
jgi:hypothetical protein